MRPVLPVLFVVSCLLAGCTDPKTEDADDPTTPPILSGDEGTGGTDFSQGMPIPPWDVGDWWQYKVQYHSGESFEAKIIVHAVEGDTYRITSDERALILRAQFQHHPNFADVRKSDLTQRIHGQDAPDLRSPMTNGTWTGKYRDFDATWNSTYVMLDTPKGTVPGFRTAMSYDVDGLVRITNAWSPVTKWFTEYTFDFNGLAPVDMTMTLQDWGTDHTGTFPIVTIIDGVHRAFPAVGLAAPDGTTPPAAPSAAPNEAFTVGEEGSSVLWGMFAGAGGPGRFEATVTPPAGRAPHLIEWQPAAASGHFGWGELPNAAAGEWMVEGQGAAQGFAFMFLETYEARFGEGSLP